MKNSSTIPMNCNVGISTEYDVVSSKGTSETLESCTTQSNDSKYVLDHLRSDIDDRNDSGVQRAEKMTPLEGILSKITFDEMYQCLFGGENVNERNGTNFQSSCLQEKDEILRACNKINLSTDVNGLAENHQTNDDDDMIYGVSLIQESTLDDNDEEITPTATIEEALGRLPTRPAKFEGIEALPKRVKLMPADAVLIKRYIADNVH